MAFRFSPAAGKKNGKKTWNRTRHSNPRLPPSARTRQRVCTRQTGGEEGESHQPDARRINAIIARSAWRFIDTRPHHFGCPFNRPFDCFPAYSTCLAFRAHICARYLIFLPSRSLPVHATLQFRFAMTRVTLVEQLGRSCQSLSPFVSFFSSSSFCVGKGRTREETINTRAIMYH